MAGENRNGVVELDFGDGTHRFRLAIGQLEELQEKTGVGPYVLLQRLMSGEWHTADVRETLRLGLVGGGMGALEALNLTRRYIDDRSDWVFNSKMAYAIMGAAILGAPEEESGKSEDPEAVKRASTYPKDGLPSEDTTGQPLSSG